MTRFKISKTVKIGGHIYEVEFRDELGDLSMGHCKANKLRITIDKNLPRSQQEETFLHECLHAIFDQTGLSRDLEDKEEERMIQPLGHSLYQLLKDNNLWK